MARYDRGWVKYHRKLSSSDIGQSPTRLLLFLHLVTWANYQESWVEWKGKPKRLSKGQLVTSLTELSAQIEVHKNTIKKHLEYLRLRESIVYEACTAGLLVSIQNYDKYQSSDAEGSTESERKVDGDCDEGSMPGRHGVHNIKNITIQEGKKESVHPGKIQDWLMGDEAKSFRDFCEFMFDKHVPRTIKENYYGLAAGFDFDLDKLSTWHTRYCSAYRYKEQVAKGDHGRLQEKASALLCESGIRRPRGDNASA